MSLKDLQEQIKAKRASRNDLSEQWQRSREETRSISRDKARLQRQGQQDSKVFQKLIQRESELAKSIPQLEGDLHAQQVAIDRLSAQLHELPPQQLVSELNSTTPVLLFPVRLETRFKQVEGVNQLWLRIYPDDININTHEEQLTEDEVQSAQTYWQEVWQAGNDQDLLLGAWRMLANKYGFQRAAWIVKTHQPNNPQQQGQSSDNSEAIQPQFDSYSAKQEAWSLPPRTMALPDRFVVEGYVGGKKVMLQTGRPVIDPLIAGPNPSHAANDDEGFKEGEPLKVDREMQWMVDFDEAVNVGMGMRIDLDGANSKGFDRIVVLGLRLSEDDSEGQQTLQSLINNQHYTEDGISLAPIGTATNNTESKSAGFKSFDPADDESAAIELGDPLFDHQPHWTLKTDGQYLAEYLGIEPQVLEHLQFADGYDQRDARAMNTALWPATWGYFLEEMLDPVLTTAQVHNIRQFFTQYVSARGPIPTLRIGNQPYGILATSSLSRWNYDLPRHSVAASKSSPAPFEKQIYDFLMKLQPYWKQWAQQVSHAGQGGDSQKTLLDILGLHASSAEFHHRFAISLEQLSNMLKLKQLSLSAVDLEQWFKAIWSGQLDEFDLVEKNPSILEKVFYNSQTLLDGPLVTDEPLSESKPLSAINQDDENYLQWLAESDIDTIRRHDFGRKEGEKIPAPRALMYLMLRHSVMNAYWDSAWNFYQSANLGALAPRLEPTFLYISDENPGHSKFSTLYRQADDLAQAHPTVFADPAKSVAEQISAPEIIRQRPETRSLHEVRKVLECLQQRPTYKLARAFSEHIDLCSYRLDAWLLGLVNQRLQHNRLTDGVAQKGIYLGAYGWLENVRPKAVLQDYHGQAPEEFLQPQDPPLQTAANNAGFIHAPSLNHATTAAVLRNAYITHAQQDNKDVTAVNLSSERMRMAMSIIEGTQNGQPLGALLGYQFERGLHDRYNQAEVDQFIYPLRKKFPLVADQITPSNSDVTIDAIEARNVIDAVSLLRHIDEKNNANYPFELSGLPTADTDQAKAINDEVNRLQDIMDAVSDLMISENVYQVVRGNYDRAGAVLSSLSRAETLPTPEILQTPRSGFAMTHRVGIQFESNVIDHNPYPGTIPLTPRAKAEPGINKWLASLWNSDPTQLANVQVTEIRVGAGPSGETVEEAFIINLADLSLQAIDLVYLHEDELTQQQSVLDELIIFCARRRHNLDHANALRIDYTAAVAGKITLFEMMPLLKNLRTLIVNNRALNAQDLMLPSDGPEDYSNDASPDLNPQGYDTLRLKTRVENLLVFIQQLVTDLVTANSQIAVGASASLFSNMQNHLLLAATLKLNNVLPQSALEQDEAAVTSLKTLATNAITQLNERIAEYNKLMPIDETTAAADQVSDWISAGQTLTGKDFSWTAEFNLKLPDELQQAYDDREHILRHAKADKPFPVDEWLFGVARVREKLKAVEQSLLLVENFQADNSPLITPMQLPYKADDYWLALEYPADYEIDGDRLLLSLLYSGPFDKDQAQAGLFIDEWVEVVPTRNETSGISFHFDAPNSEPPNTCLLAVSPQPSGQWQWDDLTATINETLDLAKQRAVEPAHLDESKFAQFSPATLLPTTRYLITVATNLLANVGHFDAVVDLPTEEES
jgi:hypothetical protein